MAIPTPPKPSNHKWLLTEQRDKYVYFSPWTKGQMGLAVKIHSDLFMPFFLAVDPKTHDGQLVIRTIESLKSKPIPEVLASRSNTRSSQANVERMNNILNAFQYSLIVKNVQVYYLIEQEPGVDNTKTVYITNLRVINRDQNEAPGLYKKKALGAKAEKMSGKDVNGCHVYINGLAAHVDEAFKHAKDRSSTEDGVKNLTLFYAPATVANDLGIWRSPGQSHRTGIAVKELTEVFQKNIKASQGVHWLVEGEGCALLSKALEGVSGELHNHTFKFINPKADTPKLLQTISQKKGKLLGEFFSYSNNKAAYIALAQHKEALLKQIGLLPEARNYDRITRRKITEQITDLSTVEAPLASQSATARSDRQTFTQALAKAERLRTNARVRQI